MKQNSTLSPGSVYNNVNFGDSLHFNGLEAANRYCRNISTHSAQALMLTTAPGLSNFIAVIPKQCDILKPCATDNL
jgi:hypothetical protein